MLGVRYDTLLRQLAASPGLNLEALRVPLDRAEVRLLQFVANPSDRCGAARRGAIPRALQKTNRRPFLTIQDCGETIFYFEFWILFRIASFFMLFAIVSHLFLK